MKKSEQLLAAEKAVQAKRQEVDEATQALERIKLEHKAAVDALRAAWAEADKALPQCHMVTSSRMGVDTAEVKVIVRKTPGGMLVVRSLGDHDGKEKRFKWATHLGRFLPVDRENPYSSASRYLIDVPAEYLPK